MKITPGRVREVLSYDPLTGVFIWKHRCNVNRRWNTKNAGKVAGSAHNGGYIHIAIDGRKYLSHYLAWLFMMGEHPTAIVDHRNLDKRDNRFENLRMASAAESSANISTRKNSKSGFRGVYWLSSRNRWIAQIHKDKIGYRIGSFKDRHKAAEAYAIKARELYGEFCPDHLREAA